MMSIFETWEGHARDMVTFHNRAYLAALASGRPASAEFHNGEADKFLARLNGKAA